MGISGSFYDQTNDIAVIVGALKLTKSMEIMIYFYDLYQTFPVQLKNQRRMFGNCTC